MEKDLTYLGSSAIEDKLQDNVAETIENENKNRAIQKPWLECQGPYHEVARDLSEIVFSELLSQRLQPGSKDIAKESKHRKYP